MREDRAFRECLPLAIPLRTAWQAPPLALLHPGAHAGPLALPNCTVGPWPARSFWRPAKLPAIAVAPILRARASSAAGGIRAVPRGQGPRLVTSVAPPEAPQQLLPGAREDAQERRRRGIRTSGWHCEARGFPSVWQPRHRRAVHRRHSRRRSARTGRPGSLPGGGGPCRRIVPGRAPLGASRGTCDDEPSR